MITIDFEGWFQCRLATDPDPVDEPRGVSGYMKALPGEPDFDRIIRFQSPPVQRSYTPEVGVRVKKVSEDGVSNPNHPLIGASVELMNDAKFYGYNGIVADDGAEAIVPFGVSIKKGPFLLERLHAEHEDFPFTELLAKGAARTPEENRKATGISDIEAYIKERQALLTVDYDEAQAQGNMLIADTLRRRIAFLGTPSAFGFFDFRMSWSVILSAPANVVDTVSILPPDELSKTWHVELWTGAWDADAASGYTGGTLTLGWNAPTMEVAEQRQDKRARRVPTAISTG